MKIAIAGNIASGKSTVQKFLEEYGYKVLDTDKCGHQALTLTCVKKALAGWDIFDDKGEISRPKLGQIVFNDPHKKSELESLIHPIIKQNILDFFEQNKADKLLFAGIPLIFESNMENLFDKIVFIYTEDELRKKRLVERNNYTEEYALLRINSQRPQEEKLAHCDYIIYNNGSVSELKLQIRELIQKLA